MFRLVIRAIKAYQYGISAVLPPSCRFYPTCSDYAVQAIARYGVVKGTGLALTRLCRCHPWHSGGIDPLP